MEACATICAVTDPRRLLSSPQAADMFGLAQSTLWRWHHADPPKIRADYVTPGGHLRWDPDRLARFLRGSREQMEATHVPDPSTSPEQQPVAAAIVTSERGVLAGRRNDGKPPWTFLAGEVEPGESASDAAVREVKEESGLEVRAGRFEIGRRVHPHTGRTMIYLACVPVGPTDVFVGDPEELAEVAWLSLVEVDERMPGMFTPVREHLGRVLP